MLNNEFITLASLVESDDLVSAYAAFAQLWTVETQPES
jgi:hypothetical protein